MRSTLVGSCPPLVSRVAGLWSGVASKVAVVPFVDRAAASPVLCLCPLCQGYGDHKPKSSTAAQEVKTLDGIFTEQVSTHSRARGTREAPVEKVPPAGTRLSCSRSR